MRHFNVSRFVRLRLLATNSAPKGAFVVDSWRYEPIVTAADVLPARFDSGFVLRVCLHPGENRWHFERSMRATRSRGRDSRTLVVASVVDLIRPGALVRCVKVSTYSLKFPGDSLGAVTMRESDPVLEDAGTAYLCRREEVREDAIWLIVPVSNHNPPSSIWGHLPERYEVRHFVLDHDRTKSSRSAKLDEGLRQRVMLSRRNTFIRWVLLGPFAVGLVWLTRWGAGFLPTGDTELLRSAKDLTVTVLGTVGRYYALVFVIAAMLAWNHLWGATVRASAWRRKEAQVRLARTPHAGVTRRWVSRLTPRKHDRFQPWTGGTREGLALGDLVSRGIRPRRGRNMDALEID